MKQMRNSDWNDDWIQRYHEWKNRLLRDRGEEQVTKPMDLMIMNVAKTIHIVLKGFSMIDTDMRLRRCVYDVLQDTVGRIS